MQLAASDLIQENIGVVRVGQNPITAFDDPLDLAQPVDGSVVWFLVLAHRWGRPVPL
jgi:hypothetical protein